MNRKSFFPAEWHPQSAIQLTWPHEATDWNGYLDDICKTYVEMADAITQHERLVVVSPSTDDVKAQLSKKLSPEQLLRVIYHQCLTNDTWARDHGFLTLVDDTQEPTLLDFRFNGWGEKFPSVLDNAIIFTCFFYKKYIFRIFNYTYCGIISFFIITYIAYFCIG